MKNKPMSDRVIRALKKSLDVVARFIELPKSPINWATTIAKYFVCSPEAHFFRDLIMLT